ncbi:unnamed protein product [Microthlaspi erraticum]|uniref:Uncharacterized protein n=1 Tax=Microthlaspi erraticum TaxID=1685480 RepID=A0A6D2LCY0_9BRAS|nr:unnamed protein product [Microthlaspi erraticum]
MYESGVVEEKKVFAVDGLRRPSARKWKRARKVIPHDNRGFHVIDEVVYCCVSGGKVMWCEASELECLGTEAIEWREVMGLEALRDLIRASRVVSYGGAFSDSSKSSRRLRTELVPDDAFAGHKLSNSGPNMLLFWDVLAPQKLEVSLERRKGAGGGEIWGSVVWSEAVMTRDPPPPHRMHCKILHSVSLNL